jgi:hypothetical protein
MFKAIRAKRTKKRRFREVLATVERLGALSMSREILHGDLSIENLAEHCSALLRDRDYAGWKEAGECKFQYRNFTYILDLRRMQSLRDFLLYVAMLEHAYAWMVEKSITPEEIGQLVEQYIDSSMALLLYMKNQRQQRQ